ncbi:tubulin polymerization-promoting protein family member 2-like isoform X2 [Parasteatoda tepidariorum]|uniref:tubulin polymerization-promoting protein family member 2-like isoform X2 n=1 Tax=Parasteatoda tepidariorum TaxID=114398 RepID=UPI00077FD4E5|nr:uncharacterized protein LOC107442098 isoform X2 [Parasteatoda tepidariorum]
MLQTQLVKLAEPRTPRGATDDRSVIGHPRARVLPPPLFSKRSSPESDEHFDDPYDVKFSTLNHQMKSSFTERGNTETRFFWMIDQMSFNQLFRLYARFGDTSKSGEYMTLTCSDKWLRNAKVLDNRRVTTTDTGIYFKQIAKFKKSLNFKTYQEFLEFLAKKKNLNFNEMKYKMVTCGPPESYKTTQVDNRKSVHRAIERTRKNNRHYWRRETKRRYEDFFSNCQCQHGYSSQISYCFPDDLPVRNDTENDEDWFPEE